MGELAKIESFRREIALVETLEDLKKAETKGKALALLAKEMKIHINGQNELGRSRVELEKIKGAKLDEMFPSKIHSSYTMEDEGINFRESSNARLIKDEPELDEVVMNEIELNGEVITPTKVATQVRKKKKEIRNKELKPAIIPDGKYRIIYADPPWNYGDKRDGRTTGAEDHYPSMTISELCLMPIKDLTEENAVLFLWVTSPLLEECFEVIKAWGFKYKTSFIWDKIKHNMGHYNSVRHELLLVCTKGSCLPDEKKLFDSVYSEERTEHSVKPEHFRNIIDTLYLHGNKIELFARNINKEGWTTWGNQA